MYAGTLSLDLTIEAESKAEFEAILPAVKKLPGVSGVEEVDSDVESDDEDEE